MILTRKTLHFTMFFLSFSGRAEGLDGHTPLVWGVSSMKWGLVPRGAGHSWAQHPRG